MPLPNVKKLCGWIKDNGLPCENPAMEPIGRCNLHGGSTPIGPASVHYKHGKYCRHRNHLPARLAEAFEAALDDPDLLNLRPEIAALDARIADLEQRVDTGECGELWAALLEASKALSKAQDKANRALLGSNKNKIAECGLEVEQALEALQDLCREGAADYAAWSEVLGLFQLRAKLIDANTKRRAAEQKDVPIEKVAAMLAEIEATVNLHVTDPQGQREITALFRRLAVEHSGQD